FPNGTTATLGAISPFGTATASVKVRLDETAIQPASVDFNVTVADASAAIPSIAVPASAAVNLDVMPAASASDYFEAPTLAWTANSGWLRQNDDAGNHFASVKVAVGGDHTLQTPGLMVMAGQHLMISFQHRFNFQHIGSALSDGGVLEISTNGTTFT